MFALFVVKCFKPTTTALVLESCIARGGILDIMTPILSHKRQKLKAFKPDYFAQNTKENV